MKVEEKKLRRVGCDESLQINKVDTFLQLVNHKINYHDDCVCRCI